MYIIGTYIKTLPYANATLCQNFKAIGEEVSEITGYVQTNIYIFIYIDRCCYEGTMLFGCISLHNDISCATNPCCV